MNDILRPQPDPESAPFWAALRDHRIDVQRCDDCGLLRFPPRPLCRRCGGAAATWTPVPGRGRVLTWTVIHHVTHPAFARRVPYTIVAVALDAQDGLVMYGNLRPPAAAPRSGLPVEAVFEKVDSELTLVQWTPALRG
jgi:uncharacterized OB-fold protein